jgi:hypothetical protein
MPLGRYQAVSSAAAGDAVYEWLDLFRALVNLKITPAGSNNTVLHLYCALQSFALSVYAASSIAARDAPAIAYTCVFGGVECLSFCRAAVACSAISAMHYTHFWWRFLLSMWLTLQHAHVYGLLLQNTAYIEHVQDLQAAAVAAGSSADEARLQYLADELTKVKLTV